MARYILTKGYELCGWKGLPFALRHPNIRLVDFFNREQYQTVLAMDGRHNIELTELQESQQKLFYRFLKEGVIKACDENERLEAWQEYKCYPAMFKTEAQWSITGHCNYNCRHCFMSAPDYKGKDLTLEQCVCILDELQRCGIRSIGITGGEALVHPRFWDIVDEMNKRRICMTTLYSNGELITPQLLNGFEKRHMRPVIHMSFDGVGWHDWIRGIDGAQESVVRAFTLCRERGFVTSASMCLHKHNIATLPESIRLLAELGAVHVKINVAAPEGRWASEAEHFITQDDAIRAIIGYLPQYVADEVPISAQFCGFLEFDKLRGRISIPYERFTGKDDAVNANACGAVRRGMYISPTGMVLPCMPMGGTPVERLFDNIFDMSLSEILTDSYFRKMSGLKMGECIDHNERCRDCKYQLVCGAGCRACACAGGKTDFLGVDEETCDFFLHGWYEKAAELRENFGRMMEAEEKDASMNQIDIIETLC